jgi:hypothetical protein
MLRLARAFCTSRPLNKGPNHVIIDLLVHRVLLFLLHRVQPQTFLFPSQTNDRNRKTLIEIPSKFALSRPL